MSYRKINIAIIVGIIAMLGVLLAVGFSGMDQLGKLNEARYSLQRTSDTLVTLKQILETMQNAETGQRGFLITGREDYLVPYNAAQPQAQRLISQLKELTQGNVDFEKSIDALEQTIETKFFELKRTIALRRSQGFEAARAVVITDRGKRAMDTIRTLVGQLSDDENRLLINRTHEQDKNWRKALLLVFFICFVATTFQIIMGFATINFLRKQKQAERAIKESDERFRLLLSGIKDYAIFMLDPEGTIITWNEGAQKIHGYKAQEVIGKHVSILHIAEESKDKVNSELEIAANTGFYEEEGQRLRKDRNKFWASVVVRPLFDESGKLTGFVKVTRDITEKKEVERRVSEFYSMVSHELRTPLTSIRGTLSLMEGGRLGPMSERAGQLAHIARLESDRLVRLINDILDIRKIEAGKLELRFENTSPTEIVEPTFESLQNMANERSIALKSKIETSERIDCDRDRIVQVLTNLISNAIKFSQSGDEIIVKIESMAPDIMRFSVIDKGPGIAKEQISKLFGLFQQLDSSDSRPKGGTGLGLAISKAIVEQHGGKIGVDSVTGEGSTFWFELPRKKQMVTAINRPTDATHRVLLVEDDHNLCVLLSEMLASQGFAADEASSLKQAAEYLANQPKPDIVVLDINLPDGNGLSLLDKLRENQKTAHTPVVVMTGREPSLGTYGHPLLIDWIRKPFDEKRLLSALKLALRMRIPGKARVLVADDDEATRELIKQELEHFNVECFEATDGIEAVHLARTKEPDLIILDLAMPAADGFDVINILKDEKAKSTPLLVYTARDLNEDDKQKLTLGLSAHLTKSRTSENEFLDTIRNLLNGLVSEHKGEKTPISSKP